ncbi:MAG: tetratricopeptide repeat protein [Planctomycetes bacterium]|nr:tetratricopeptide repeat protein [Planctomycetota bacterium]
MTDIHSSTSNVVSGRARKPLTLRKRIVFSLVSTCLLLTVLEMALAMAGVKPQYLSADPFVGFRPGPPLFVREGDLYQTNPSKRMFFNDQSFAACKKQNTYRIFCLGGSTTFGHPYHDSTSFVGWLRARLQDAEPDRDWEVINCGGISYASYRISRLMQELEEFQPDMFIFYEGHNEFLEERTYGSFKRRGVVTQAADLVVARTRVGTALASIMGRQPTERKPMLSPEVDTILDHSVGPEQYHRDPAWRHAVIVHFQRSLQRVCGLARDSGARLVIVKPASNVRDFTPFKSERGIVDPADPGRWSLLTNRARRAYEAGQFAEAATDYLAAASVDPHHAMTQWNAGNALALSGRMEESLPYFQRAIDEDVCPLRAVSEIQTAIETVAREQHVPLVDFPRIIADELEKTTGHRIPGDESFLDHVHPTIENNRRLGWALFDELVALDVVHSVPSNDEVIQRISVKVLRDLDGRKQALALVQVAQVLSWGGKNAEAMRPLERAEELFPGLSDVMFYKGRLLEKSGKSEEAFACYVDAVRRNPEDFFALARLGQMHWTQREYDQAEDCYRRAIRATPDAAPARFRADLHVGLGLTLTALDRREEAAVEFQMALRIVPGTNAAVLGLQSVQDKSSL